MVSHLTNFTPAIFINLKKQEEGEICASSDSPSDWQPALCHKLTVRMVQPMDGLDWEQSEKTLPRPAGFDLLMSQGRRTFQWLHRLS